MITIQIGTEVDYFPITAVTGQLVAQWLKWWTSDQKSNIQIRALTSCHCWALEQGL